MHSLPARWTSCRSPIAHVRVLAPENDAPGIHTTPRERLLCLEVRRRTQKLEVLRRGFHSMRPLRTSEGLQCAIARAQLQLLSAQGNAAIMQETMDALPVCALPDVALPARL